MEGEEEGEEGGEHSLDTSMAPTEDGIIISAMAGGDPMEYSLGQEAAMATGAAEEAGEEISSVDLLATAVNLVSQAQMNKGACDRGCVCMLCVSVQVNILVCSHDQLICCF